MKKYAFSMVGFLLLVSLHQSALASPRGGSNSAFDYLAGESDKDNWVGGLYLHGRERYVTVNGVPADLEEYRVMVYAGYHLIKWATLYGLAGYSDADLSPSLGGDSDYRPAYGIGLEADLFSHVIQDPLMMEDEIRINAQVSYQRTDVEAFGEDRTLDELLGSLTVSIVNDVGGSKLFLPESIAVFAGPVYGHILSDDLDDGRDEVWGLTGGIEFFHSKRVSTYAQLEEYENTGFSAGVNIRF